jgi:hypothetical protein
VPEESTRKLILNNFNKKLDKTRLRAEEGNRIEKPIRATGNQKHSKEEAA